MLRHLTLAFLLLPFLFASCSKGSDNGGSSNSPNQFAINGLHDINLNTSATSNILPINVMTTKGAQEKVTISVTGLPAGISATIDPATGTPTFGSLITFAQSGFVAGGTYPIKIVGSSSSFTKEYELSLTLPSTSLDMFCPAKINLDSTLGFSVSVVQQGGIVEPVTVSVSDLPSGLSASIQNATGTPSLNSGVLLSETNPIAAGTYNIKVTATSAHATLTKNVIVTASAFNGFVFDGTYYRAFLSHDAGSFTLDVPSMSGIYGRGRLGTNYVWSPNDGTYTYPVTSSSVGSTTIGLSVGNYSSTSTNAGTLTLKIVNGKFTITLPTTALSEGGNPGNAMKNVSIQASER